MSTFFQLFLVWGVLLLFILILYLVDKVNGIYRAQVREQAPQTYSDGLFGELSAKTLWDAMSGIPVPGVDTQLVSNLKVHYEPVLRQHIEKAFWEGYHHAREGRAGVPTNNAMIPTPRGSLESWLPLHHLASLYQAGADFTKAKPGDLLRLQQNIDQVTNMVYARVGLSLLEPFSTQLLVHPPGMAPAPEEAPAQSTSEAAELPALAAPQEAPVLQPDVPAALAEPATQEVMAAMPESQAVPAESMDEAMGTSLGEPKPALA